MSQASQLATMPRYRHAVYWIGDIVYLRVRSEREKGMVTGLTIRPNGLSYAVTWDGGFESCHFEIELSSEFVPDWASDDSGGGVSTE